MKKKKLILKKYSLLIIKIIFSIPFVPFIIFTRLISPLKIIRFGKIRTAEYGHFIGATYVYLMFQRKKNFNFLDFFFFDNFISNKHWAKLLKKNIKIFKIIELLYIANFFVPGYRRHIYNIQDINGKNEKIYGSYVTQTIKKFKRNTLELELENGNRDEIKRFLIKNKIKKKSKFVVIFTRDNNYKKKINLIGNLNMDFSYHDYMDCNIQNFIPTIKHLNKLGFTVIRMGKFVKDKIHYKSKMFIDYSTSEYKSDFLDLWLKKNCEFAVCSPSGFAIPLFIFNKPIVFVNCIPLLNIFDMQKNHFFLPKKIRYKNSKGYVSLQKQIKNNYYTFRTSKDYSDNNLLVCENTKKEIKNSVIDFLNKGNKKGLTKEKVKLIKNFNFIVKKINKINKNIQLYKTNISPSFLVDNSRWFLKSD